MSMATIASGETLLFVSRFLRVLQVITMPLRLRTGMCRGEMLCFRYDCAEAPCSYNGICMRTEYLRIDCFIRQVQLLEIREHVTIMTELNCQIVCFGNYCRRLREVAYMAPDSFKYHNNSIRQAILEILSPNLGF